MVRWSAGAREIATRRRKAPSGTSVSAVTMLAGYGRMTQSCVGLPTHTENGMKPHRRIILSTPSMSAVLVPAGCERTARWSVGGGGDTGLRLRKARSNPSVSAAIMPAGCERTAQLPAGAATVKGKPRHRKARSGPSTPAPIIPAECERMARLPAGVTTVKGKPRHRKGPFNPSVPAAVVIPAGCEWTELLSAGVATVRDKPRHRKVRSNRSAPVTKTTVEFARTGGWFAGAGTTAGRPRRRRGVVIAFGHLPP